MVNSDEVACFFTCGHTEAGGMQKFLGKISDGLYFKQYLPNKTRKRKGQPKNINREVSGLSGQKLLDTIYHIVELRKTEIRLCKAVLIEDDTDGRFHGKTDKEREEYCSKSANEIYRRLGREIPIVFLWASPEIESWFIGDWENGFGFCYKNRGFMWDLKQPECRQYVEYRFRQDVKRFILDPVGGNIEEYGFHDPEGQYVKLSNTVAGILKNIQETIDDAGINPLYAKEIKTSRCIRYLKTLYGEAMLRNIRPERVAASCPHYFREAYYEIINLDLQDA